MAVLASAGKYTGNTNNALKARLMRDSTEILFAGDGLSWTNTDLFNIGNVALNKLDSPATTSAITYKVQFASNVSGQTAAVNYYRSSDTATSTIVAMEIGA
jgi:hypothetical protein